MEMARVIPIKTKREHNQMEMARVIPIKTKREHNQESRNDRTAVTFRKLIMVDEDEESTNTPQNIQQNEFQALGQRSAVSDGGRSTNF